MIETWSLPGPARIVAQVIETLEDGYQCIPSGSFPSGFRRAVEAALVGRQMLLSVIYDDPALSPQSLIGREVGARPGQQGMPAEVWWIEDVAPERARSWMEAARGIGEHMRHLHPGERLRLVLPLPQGTQTGASLGVAAFDAKPLGRLDLEVAARYVAAAKGVQGPLARVRMEAAVEMALPQLPDPRALHVLAHWIEAPEEAFCNPDRFALHAREGGHDTRLPEFELWRVQHAALLSEIERMRLTIVDAHRSRWRVPCEVATSDNLPAKLVHHPELLELRHLCTQLRQAREPWTSALAQRLRMLRDLRNALSHLEHATVADFFLFAEEPGP